jgi:predicted dehydrogenase
MVRMGLVGLGKMGVSHLAIANAHPAVTLAAVCDSSGYSLQVLNKYAAFRTYTPTLREAERIACQTG